MLLNGRHRTALVAVFLAAACAAATGRTEPATPAATCEFQNVERIVAVGDVHGAYERFLGILKTAQVIDAANKWSGGKTHLVQTGDVLDRGPDSKKVLEFLRRLAKEATAAGGAVHSLLGNHEAMRLTRDYRYVDPGEYAAFVTKDSERVLREALASVPPEQRAAVAETTPLGYVELVRAFAPDQDLGQYLRTLDPVVKINGIMFMHGGISPAVAAMSCTAINDTIRRDLGRDLEKTIRELNKSLATREDGPLWYRGLALEPEDDFLPEFEKILKAQGARAFVLGHTADPGPIRTRFNNRVFLIDTGMQPAYLPNGRAAALEIKGEVFTAIYEDGRQVIRGGRQ